MSGGQEGAGGIGGLLARTDANGSAFYHADGNGNVTAMINSSGNVLAKYQYDSFGNILNKSGSLADVNLYRFSSKETHLPSGLYYFNFRYYEPNLQRWLSKDIVGEIGGLNLHEYVGNNPINFADPLGLWSLYKWAYTGDGNASDELYQDSLDSATDYLLGLLPDAIDNLTELSVIDPTPLSAATANYLSSFGPGTSDWDNMMMLGMSEDLATPARRCHILDGEQRPDGSYGGGHAPGRGFPGKSEFPTGWSRDKIMHYISDVATDPASKVRRGARPGDFFLTGTREGIEIEVLIRNGDIWTGYPTNVPRNPKK